MDFSIEKELIRSTAVSLGEVDQKIRVCGKRINMVANQRIDCGAANVNFDLRRALQNRAAEVYTIAQTTQAMSSKLKEIVRTYEETESRIGGYVSGQGREKSLWEKLKDKDFSDSLVHKETIAQTTILGVGAEKTSSTDVLKGELSAKTAAEWDAKKGKIGAEVSVKAEGSLVEGKVSSDFGLFHHTKKVKVGNVVVSGGLGATLFNNGRFEPGLQANAKAKAVALHGERESHIGSDDNNVHGALEGDLGIAKAEAEAHVGRYTYKDETTGEVKTGFGVGASAGAEAYLAEGSVKGGLNILGIKIDASLTGKAGGAGAKAKANVGTDSVEGELGLGLGLGAGLKVKVDWTGFKTPW